MSLAIVPGSFDPITLGHLELIKDAASRYDEVAVAVMINRDKTYLFNMDERIRMAELTVAELPNVRVLGDSGMLIDLFDRLGADAVVKSYRNPQDYEYETYMANWNREHNPRFVTVLIPAVGENRTLSSTEVRTQMEAGILPQALVHPSILPMVKEKIDDIQNKGEQT